MDILSSDVPALLLSVSETKVTFTAGLNSAFVNLSDRKQMETLLNDDLIVFRFDDQDSLQ